MNKLFKRLCTLAAGIAMAIGVGVAIGEKGSVATRVHAANVTDLLRASDLPATGSGYTNFEVSKTATYIGQTAKNGSNIQINSNGINRSIATSVSGGYIRKVTVAYGNANSKTIAVKVSNTAYAMGTSFNSGTTAGTLSSSNLTVTISGNYSYVALWPSGATYPSSVSFEWEPVSAKTLSSIAVSTHPTKTTYIEGETFDPTGLVITRSYSDGTSDTYTYANHTTEFDFSPSTSTELTTSNKSVTITYGDKTCSQAITVSENPNYVLKLSNSGASGKSGYDDGAERTSTIKTVGFGNKGTMANSTRIQLKANQGIIYNTSAFPSPIGSVTVVQEDNNRAMLLQAGSSRLVSDTAADYEITGGSTTGITAPSTAATMKWTFAANTNYTFFALKVNQNNAAYISSVTIELKEAPTPATGITLSSANFTPVNNVITIEKDSGSGSVLDTLTATVTPNDATDKTVTWSSNNESVALVDNGAVIVATNAVGQATITATANGGTNVTATMTYSVVSTEKIVTVSKSFGSKVMLGKNNAQRDVTGISASSQNITSPVYKWEIVNPSAANVAEISGTTSTPTFTIKNAGTLEVKVSARASADPDVEGSYTACATNLSIEVVNYGGDLSWQNRSNMSFKEGVGFDISSTSITFTLNDGSVVDYAGDYSALDLYMGTSANNVTLVTSETIASIHSASAVNNHYYKIVDSNYDIGSSAINVSTVNYNPKATITLNSVGNVTEITKNQTIYLIADITEGWGDTVTYTSSSTYVTVDSNGVVKSGNTAVNNVTITASLENGNSATFTMSVLESKVYTIEEAYAMVSGFNTAEADMYYGSDTAGTKTEIYTVQGFYYFYKGEEEKYDAVCLVDDPANPEKILKLFDCEGDDVDLEEGEILTANGYLNDYMHGGNYYLTDGELISHEQYVGDRTVDFTNSSITPESGTTTYSFGADFSHPGTIHIAYTDGFSRDVSLASATISANMTKLGSQTLSVYVDDTFFSGNSSLLIGTYEINITNVGAVYSIPAFSATGENFTRSSLSDANNKWKQSGAGSDYAAANSPYLLKMDDTDDYIEYVFADGESNNLSSYTCTISLKKIGGTGNSYFNLIGVNADGDPISGVTGTTTTAQGAQNAITTVSGTLSNSNNAEIYAIRFVFQKASNVGVSGATIEGPAETKTDLINAQDDAMAQFLAEFKTCLSGWTSRNDIVRLVTEYNAMHADAKTAFESQVITDYDWTNANEYNISTHQYTGGSKTLNSVSAIQKLKYMVDLYNRTLQQGESTLVLQTPSGNFSTLSSFRFVIFNAENANTAITVSIISIVSGLAVGGYFFLRKRKED